MQTLHPGFPSEATSGVGVAFLRPPGEEAGDLTLDFSSLQAFLP